jgi:predicted nucleotidyltransferase
MPAPTREDIQRIVDRIVEGHRPEKVILFGSLAWGKPGEGSDVDLLVVKETTARPFNRAVEVRKLISRTQGTTPVDLLVMTPSEVEQRADWRDPFICKILDAGTLLYAA